MHWGNAGMIRIAIVEDDANERRTIRDNALNVAQKEGVEIALVEFTDGLAFLGGYEKDFDIVLMDIEMPGMNGMETARALRRMDDTVILIFITNLTQYAVQGYEVDALDYIVKPIVPLSFELKMKRAFSRTVKRVDDVIQVFSEAHEQRNMRISAIRYVEVDGHYLIWHTMQGDFKEYATLKDAEQRIGRDYFVRCNRSYLVNLRHVDAIRRDNVVIGGDELIISRPQRKAFLAACSAFLGGSKS